MLTTPDTIQALLASLFSSIGQQPRPEDQLQPEVPPPENPTNMMIPGFEMDDGQTPSPEQAAALAEMSRAFQGGVSQEPPSMTPLSTDVQESLQPEVNPTPDGGDATESQQTPSEGSLLEPSYQGPAEAEPGQPKPDASAQAAGNDDIYKQITSRLLADLDDDKIDWGRAMSLMALAWKNPEAAHGLLEQDRQRKQGTKAMLLQAAGQETSLRRAEESRLGAEQRQDTKIAADKAEQRRREISLTRSQMNRQASDANVDLSGITWSDKTFEDDVAEAQSRISKANQWNELEKVARKNGIPMEGIARDGSKESVEALRARVDEYDADIRIQSKAVQVAQASPTGITPQLVNQLTAGIKNPQIKAETVAILEAARQEGELRNRTTELQRLNIQDQIDTRAARTRAMQTAAESRAAVKKMSDDARNWQQAEAAVNAAQDNIRQAKTDEDYNLAQFGYQEAVRRRDELKGQANPFSGDAAGAYEVAYRSYLPETDPATGTTEPLTIGNLTFESQEKFDEFLYKQSNQDQPGWQDAFVSLWRDFDRTNNDLGAPEAFILEFNRRAAEWATANNPWYWTAPTPASMPATGIPKTPEFMTNPMPEAVPPPSPGP